MKISRLPQNPDSKNAAFTLIELLVVISIIAILAGMSISGMGGVMQQAKKTSAKNDLIGIVTAVKGYYTDYGRYPIPTASSEDYCYGKSVSDATNDNLFNILRYPSGWSDANSMNLRQVRYLEVPAAKDPNNPKSGVDTNGVWYDPWGVPYFVFIDGDYAGDINVGKLFNSTTQFPSTVSIGVGAASVGYDLVVKNKQEPNAAVSKRSFVPAADLLSWR